MTINKLPYFDPFTFSKQFNTTVGFEPILKRLSEMSETMPKIPTYPPYNIRKVDENKYVIEMAVAGFAKSDIEVTLEGNKLVVKGNTADNEVEVPENYIFKGIANRAFTRSFVLNDEVEVKDAEMINGMLKIALERLVPEAKKPKEK